MEKRRKISIAWFLFFATLGYLLSGQWKMIVLILAGLTIALYITSRIKIKLLYVTWLIFPVLSLIFMNPIGDKTVEWCEKNNPSVLVDDAVRYIKEASDEEQLKITSNLIDKSSEVKQELINNIKDKIKTSFLKLVSAMKDLAEHLSKQFTKPKALMDNS